MNRKHVVHVRSSFDQINHLKREIIRLCGVAWVFWHSATVALYCRASLLQSATYSLFIVRCQVRRWPCKLAVDGSEYLWLGQVVPQSLHVVKLTWMNSSSVAMNSHPCDVRTGVGSRMLGHPNLTVIQRSSGMHPSKTSCPQAIPEHEKPDHSTCYLHGEDPSS